MGDRRWVSVYGIYVYGILWRSAILPRAGCVKWKVLSAQERLWIQQRTVVTWAYEAREVWYSNRQNMYILYVVSITDLAGFRPPSNKSGVGIAEVLRVDFAGKPVENNGKRDSVMSRGTWQEIRR